MPSLTRSSTSLALLRRDCPPEAVFLVRDSTPPPRALRHGRVSDDPAPQDDRLLGREGEHDRSGTEKNDRGHHEETALRTEAVQQG